LLLLIAVVPPPEEKKVEPPIEPFSKRYSRLTAKEKEIADKAKALADRESKASASEKKQNETLELLRTNPKAFFEKSGLTREEIARLYGFTIPTKAPTTPSASEKAIADARAAAAEELAAFKKELAEKEENTRKANEERQAQQLEIGKQQYCDAVIAHAKKEADNFELSNLADPEDVAELIRDAFDAWWDDEEGKKTNRTIPDHAFFASAVEKYLENQYLAKFSKSKKLSKLLTPEEKKEEEKEEVKAAVETMKETVKEVTKSPSPEKVNIAAAPRKESPSEVKARIVKEFNEKQTLARAAALSAVKK